MAQKGLKPFSYAYKQMPKDDLEDLVNKHGLESKTFRDELEENFTYLCTFGLEDPIREEVNQSI